MTTMNRSKRGLGVWVGLLLAASLPVMGSAAEDFFDFDGAGDGNVPSFERVRRNRPGGHGGGYMGGRAAFANWSEQCTSVYVEAGSERSDEQLLTSTLSEQRCYTDSEGYRQCDTRVIDQISRYVSVEVRNRGRMFPWEYDEFDICLKGHEITAQPDYDETAYTYEIFVGNDGRILADARQKKAMRSDARGVFLKSFGLSDNGQMELVLGDKWARYYEGEQTGLYIELKKDVPMWSDETLIRKELVVPVSGEYRVNLAEYVREFSKNLESGQKYFVKWGFHRIGRISLDNKNGGIKGDTQWDTRKVRYTSNNPSEQPKKDGGWPHLGSLLGS